MKDGFRSLILCAIQPRFSVSHSSRLIWASWILFQRTKISMCWPPKHAPFPPSAELLQAFEIAVLLNAVIIQISIWSNRPLCLLWLMPGTSISFQIGLHKIAGGVSAGSSEPWSTLCMEERPLWVLISRLRLWSLLELPMIGGEVACLNDLLQVDAERALITWKTYSSRF